MIPYVMRDVSARDLELFHRIRQAVEDLPDVDLGKDERGEAHVISCHLLCRAIRACFPEVTVHDGYFGPYQATHSWLTTESPDVIIDAYPWATASGSTLVYCGGMSPWRHVYRESDLSEYFMRWYRDLDRQLVIVTDALRAAIERAGEPKPAKHQRAWIFS